MQPPFRTVLVRFVLAFLGFVALTAGLVVIFPAISNGGMGIIPGMVASLMAGQHFFGQSGRRPTNGEAWRYAAVFVLIEWIISLPIAYWLLKDLLPELEGAMAIIIGITAFMIVIQLLAARLFFGMGAKQEAKRA